MRLPPWNATLFPTIVLLCLIVPTFMADRTPEGIAGLVLLEVLIMGALAIIWTAVVPRTAGQNWMLVASIGSMGVFSALLGKVTLLPALAVATLAVAWCALWSAIAWALRRWGPGISAGVPMLGASLCMALPVAGMPLVHVAGRGGGAGGTQSVIVWVIAHACPFFPALGALRPAIKIDWGTLPGMYQWSGLGQEIPLELPNAWICAGLYAAMAVGMFLLGRWLRPANAPQATPDGGATTQR